jgi:hypothetical protein
VFTFMSHAQGKRFCGVGMEGYYVLFPPRVSLTRKRKSFWYLLECLPGTLGMKTNNDARYHFQTGVIERLLVPLKGKPPPAVLVKINFCME